MQGGEKRGEDTTIFVALLLTDPCLHHLQCLGYMEPVQVNDSTDLAGCIPLSKYCGPRKFVTLFHHLVVTTTLFRQLLGPLAVTLSVRICRCLKIPIPGAPMLVGFGAKLIS